MKKALPIITLLAYIAAVVICIVNIVTGAPASLATILIFIAYVLGVMVLMFFATRSVVKDTVAKINQKADPKEEEAQSAEETTEPVEEAPEAIEEAPAEEAEAPEAVEEIAESDDTPIIPVVVAADSNDDEVDVTKFTKSRYIRSYASKLIQSEDELKGYYSIIKNAFMSYKKVTSIVSREHERIRLGRSTVGVIKLRGKTIMLYLALDPAQFEGTMYVGEDVSAMSKYADTPFLYRVNGPRKANRAARLIAMVAEKLEMEPTEQPANEDYIALFPYESDEALIEKGLIIDTEAEPASV